MPRLTVLLLSFLLFSVAVMAQSSRVSGTIADTTEKKSLINGSVLLLRPTDSILVRHTRTTAGGHFQLTAPPGHYILLVTYPSYADYVDTLVIKDSGAVVLPIIGMTLKSKLLETVVVSGNKGAVRIKGDTTEFNADSFKTQAGANVEDLLKKLPGIQVDKNGKITAQGEAVKKVLVDGEEFFGDDPTLVTQNLRADMVDKVQVYDKKSDQATFTGIDDGQREKTINLKLKNDKKLGYFGRVTGGIGTDGYYDEQLMANYFKKKEKISAYGIISNTGKTGLNWGERDSYGQSFADNIDVDQNTGSFNFTSTGNNDELDSWSGQYEGQGKPSVKTGGLHFNNKWSDDNISLNGNYKYLQLNVAGNNVTNSENILPTSISFNNQTQNFRNQITRHTADGNYEVKFDSTSSLKIQATGGTDHKTTFNEFHNDYLGNDTSLINHNDRITSTVGDKNILNSYLIWRKKLAKGRTISVAVRENYTDDKSTGSLYSNTQFYDKGGPTYDSLVDQLKDFHTVTTLIDSRATFTQPLSKTSFLVANYGVVINNSHSNRDSYNKGFGGKYIVLDSLFSNDYKYNVFTHRGGLGYTMIKKKFRFALGSDVGFTQFDQRDLVADTSGHRHFVNWYPNANFTWSFTNMRRLGFNYNGRTDQPQVTQIQPIYTNEDPLNITIGNPALKPKFTNQFRLFFNDYKVLTDRGIWVGINYSFTENDIASKVTIDPDSGKRVNQYINVQGDYRLNGWANYSFKWKKPDLRFNINGNVNNSGNVSYINGVANKTRSQTYTAGYGVYKSKEKKYDFGVQFNASYTESRSTVNTGISTKYWTYQINPETNWFLPLKFQIHAEADINLREKTPIFPNNNNVALVNGWIGKKFLKNDALLIKVAVNDLFNQNIGFNRNVNSNFISQSTYTTIRRYGMFSVVWNFTKAGTPMPPQR
ncbi:MAG TPA: TonB-dependent receptor [Puia sp.]|uniref:TonB-dependent receptor n=1 Tax=Puia sp. TaxID=2045100 RepID=UPI002C916CC3|nr:TonB-dependent receptor [Puia sp.]HVU96219.1 TonB-dependent receptor [Puia sp.]